MAVAGLNKDLSGTFRSGLANRTRGSLADNPHGWYVSLVTWGVLPHVGLFAVVVEIGELAVAAGLIWGAVLWARPEWFPGRLRFWLGVAVSAASWVRRSWSLTITCWRGRGGHG